MILNIKQAEKAVIRAIQKADDYDVLITYNDILEVCKDIPHFPIKIAIANLMASGRIEHRKGGYQLIKADH
jgi:hypothetical protein